MKKCMTVLGMVLIAIVLAIPVMSQPRYDYGPDYGDEYGGYWMGRGMGPGYGMGYGGMMDYSRWNYLPRKLPVPKNQEWIKKLRDVLALERLSFEQYTADADKYNTYMPYRMIIPQEHDHVATIEQMFKAYGLSLMDSKPLAVRETKSLEDAYELCIKMERDLIPRYEWLIKNAENRDSAAILDNILIQTRYHLAMFEHALQVGGGRMGRGGWFGHGPGMMWGW